MFIFDWNMMLNIIIFLKISTLENLQSFPIPRSLLYLICKSINVILTSLAWPFKQNLLNITFDWCYLSFSKFCKLKWRHLMCIFSVYRLSQLTFYNLEINLSQIYLMETESSRFHPYFVWIKIRNNKNIKPQLVHPYWMSRLNFCLRQLRQYRS